MRVSAVAPKQLHYYGIRGTGGGVWDSDHWAEADLAGYREKSRMKNAYAYRGENAYERALAFFLTPPERETLLAVIKRWIRKQPNLVKAFAFTVVVTVLMYGFWFATGEVYDAFSCGDRNLKNYTTGANSELCKALNHVMTTITYNQSVVLKAFGIQVAAGVGVFMYYFYDFLFGAEDFAAEFHP